MTTSLFALEEMGKKDPSVSEQSQRLRVFAAINACESIFLSAARPNGVFLDEIRARCIVFGQPAEVSLVGLRRLTLGARPLPVRDPQTLGGGGVLLAQPFQLALQGPPRPSRFVRRISSITCALKPTPQLSLGLPSVPTVRHFSEPAPTVRCLAGTLPLGWSISPCPACWPSASMPPGR